MRLSQHPRAWRAFLLLAFLLPVLLVLPHARSLVVRNAVITAYLGDIRAPITGRIEAIPLPPGAVSREGEPAMTLRNDRVSRSALARLEARVKEAERAAMQIRDRLVSMRALAAARRLEQDAFVEAVALDLSRKAQQAEDETPAREAELKAASSALQRARSVHDQGLLAPAELETAQAEYERAQAAASANQLDRERLDQQLREIRHGVFQIDIPDGVLLTRQMAQQLDLEVIQIERQALESETEWKSLQAEYEAALTAFQRLSDATIDLPAGLTVWNVYVTRSAWVNEGSLLLSVVDCSNVMADIAIDDATLELIQPGQKVNLRLFGSFDYHSASVVLVRGSAGLGDAPVLAAEVNPRGDRMGRVLVKLDQPPRENLGGQSCDIGRTAYAEFEDISVLQTILFPLFR